MILSFLRQHKSLFTNLTASAGLLTFGDYCVQKFYDKRKTLDKKRLIAATITGLAMGSEAHIWYKFLDGIMAQRTWRYVFKKVLLDQTIAAPIYTITYIISTSVFEGRTSLDTLKSDTKENFLPLYIADCAIFIPVQIINFKYISTFFRVPFMFLMSFFLNAFLSAYKHTHQGPKK